MKILSIILPLIIGINASNSAFYNNLQQRDSILIADQFEYGFTIEGLAEGTSLAMSDFSSISNDTLTLIRNWKIDTLKVAKKTGKTDIRASVVFSPFEEGKYSLPPIFAIVKANGQIDTLTFDGLQLDVKSIAIDTATFKINDIKGQMTYPVTFAEVAPWLFGSLLFIAIIVGLVLLIRKKLRQKTENQTITKEAAYIVALRQLEKYRGDKLWAGEKQKAYYSGITDILKAYIDNSFSIDAPEMTTAELFEELKKVAMDSNLYSELKDFFELADFVKFAKFVASDEDNAKALPLAVRFVTTTYQTILEAEQKIQ